MFSRRRRGAAAPGAPDWTTELEPQRRALELQVTAAVGRPTVIHGNSDTRELHVGVSRPPVGAADIVADELAALWPGFLAPADVSLNLLDGPTWPSDEMALRADRLRREPHTRAAS